jgi:hypothetical protein
MIADQYYTELGYQNIDFSFEDLTPMETLFEDIATCTLDDRPTLFLMYDAKFDTVFLEALRRGGDFETIHISHSFPYHKCSYCGKSSLLTVDIESPFISQGYMCASCVIAFLSSRNNFRIPYLYSHWWEKIKQPINLSNLKRILGPNIKRKINKGIGISINWYISEIMATEKHNIQDIEYEWVAREFYSRLSEKGEMWKYSYSKSYVHHCSQCQFALPRFHIYYKSPSRDIYCPTCFCKDVYSEVKTIPTVLFTHWDLTFGRPINHKTQAH